MTESEWSQAITETKNSLGEIVSETEKFVNENILNGGIFGFGGWNDSCGKKIGDLVVSSVQEAVDQNLNYYNCLSTLDKIRNDVQPLISVIEAAKRELQ